MLNCETMLSFDGDKSTFLTCNTLYSRKIFKRDGQYFDYISLESQIEEFCKSEAYEKIRKIDEDVRFVVNGSYYLHLRENNVIKIMI